MRLFKARQHGALMCRGLVEDVDVAADQRGNAELRQLFLQVGFGLLEKIDQRPVHIGDV